MKKFLSLVLALVMTMSLVTISAGAKDFTDGEDVNYNEAIDVMSAVKVVEGYPDGSFQPAKTLTRAEAAKVICNMILGPTTAAALSADAAPFSDVPTTHWAAGYIAYCANQGIINGYGNGVFGANDTLTGYQFMKMLLAALGYDADVEGYVGANWSINVAKQAIAIGLDDGNDEFNGTKPVTREEACLYAFNTLTTTMVEYKNKSSIVVGDITVTTSAEATKVQNLSGGGYKDPAAQNDGYTQFCEEYFPKLELRTGSASDDFGRPSNTWYVKNEKVGTYAKTADLTYEDAKSGDIYADLGLSDTVSYDVYVDGVKVTAGNKAAYDGVEFDAEADGKFELERGDDDDAIGDKGTLVEVFEDDKTITVVNTWVGQITTVEEATSKRDAYVVVGYLSTDDDDEDIRGTWNDEFETEDFEEDDIVLFTYSEKTHEIKSLEKAESVTGAVTKYNYTKSADIDGKTYKYSSKIDPAKKISTVDVDVVAYLDHEGQIIYTDDVEVTVANLAYVLDAGADTSRGGSDKWAKQLYTDGTVDVVTTSKIYGTSGSASPSADVNLMGKFVSYKTNSSNKVVLTAATGYAVNGTGAASNSTAAITNNKAALAIDGATNITSFIDSANSNTLFLLYSADDGEAKVYTGIKNVPDVKTKDIVGTFTSAALAKTGKAATVVVMYVDDSVVSNSTTDYLFLRGADPKYTEDADNTYYVFDAVVDGEITKVMLEDNATNASTIATLCAKTNVLATNYSKDGDLVTVIDSDNTAPALNTSAGALQAVTSITKISGDVITINGTGYTVADDCVFYRVSAAGKLSKVTASALRDENPIGTYFAQVSVAYNRDDEITAIYMELK